MKINNSIKVLFLACLGVASSRAMEKEKNLIKGQEWSALAPLWYAGQNKSYISLLPKEVLWQLSYFIKNKEYNSALNFWLLKYAEAHGFYKKKIDLKPLLHPVEVYPQAFAANSDTQEWSIGCTDGTIKVSKEPFKEYVNLAGHNDKLSRLLFDRKNQRLISSSWDASIKVWKRNEDDQWSCQQTLEGHKSAVNQLALDAINNQLVSLSDADGIKIWDLDTGTCINTLTSAPGKIITHFIIDTSHTIFFYMQGGHEQGDITIWNHAQPMLKNLIRNIHVTAMAFNASKNQLMVAVENDEENKIKIFDLETHGFIQEFNMPSRCEYITTHDNRLIASSEQIYERSINEKIRIFNMDAHACEAVFDSANYGSPYYDPATKQLYISVADKKIVFSFEDQGMKQSFKNMNAHTMRLLERACECWHTNQKTGIGKVSLNLVNDTELYSAFCQLPQDMQKTIAENIPVKEKIDQK